MELKRASTHPLKGKNKRYNLFRCAAGFENYSTILDQPCDAILSLTVKTLFNLNIKTYTNPKGQNTYHKGHMRDSTII